MKRIFKSDEWLSSKINLEFREDYPNLCLNAVQNQILQKYGWWIPTHLIEKYAIINYRFDTCVYSEDYLVYGWYEYLFEEPDYKEVIVKPLDPPSDVVYYFDIINTISELISSLEVPPKFSNIVNDNLGDLLLEL